MAVRDSLFERSRILMDRRQWPLVVFEVQPGDWAASLDDYLGDLLSCFDVGKPFSSVLDLSRAFMPSAPVRRRLAEFQRDHADLFGHYMLCQAVVAPNQDLKGLITSINWLSEPPMPQGIFQVRNEAIAWSARFTVQKYPRFVYLSEPPAASSQTRIRR